MSDVVTIQPGIGSFTDQFGNVYTINAADNNTADINGQPITPNGESTLTGAMELSNGSVYAQDQNSGQWYLMASKGTPGLWEWQPVSAPPGASTTVGSSESSGASDVTTAALGNDQAAMAFIGSGASDATAADSSSTSGSPVTALPTLGDFQQPTGASLSTDTSLQGSLQPDGTGTTPAYGMWDGTDHPGVTPISVSH
jgi:hypothetical protein